MSKMKTDKSGTRTAAKAKSSPTAVAQLFGKILPQNYRSRAALINQYQHFFNALESDAVFQMVKVINVEENVLTLSLPSAALMNYLRLHSQQISSQIEEQFGQLMQLKLTTSPAGAQNEQAHVRLKPAAHFSEQVSEQIKRSAKDVDDEELMQSLVNLADAISRKDT